MTHTLPRVSVIMTTYNQERFVERALRSVLGQRTSFDYEIVIADDASTDSTPEILKRYAEQHPHRIVLLRRERNMGVSANYLDAWSHCRAPYIAICEGDDWWLSPHKLERQVRWMDAHPDCSVCFHRVANYYQESGTWTLCGSPATDTFTLDDLARSNIITNLSVMYRAIPREDIPQWVLETPLFDYAMHSLHAARGNVHYIRKTMAAYRRHSNGIWSGDNLRALHLAVEIRRRLMNHFGATHPIAAANWFETFLHNSLTLGRNSLNSGDESVASEIAGDIAAMSSMYSSEPIAAAQALEMMKQPAPSAAAPRSSRLRSLTRYIPLRAGSLLLDRLM